MMTQSCSQAGEPLALWLMCLRKSGSCRGRRHMRRYVKKCILETEGETEGMCGRGHVMGQLDMHSWKKVTYARAGESLRV